MKKFYIYSKREDKTILSTDDLFDFYMAVLYYSIKRKDDYIVRIIEKNSDCQISIYACANIIKDITELLK